MGPLAKRMTDAVLDRVASQSRPKVIVAYHGSPHSFDRFDASKIGTGEGAQAYGHGLYFAGAEDTARTYRDALAQATARMPDGTVLKRPWWLTDEMIAGQLDDQRKNWARRVQAAHDAGISPEPWASELRAMEAIAGGIPFTPSGHMYEVELGVPEEALLNLDATMTQQSPEVLRALGRYAEAPRHFTLGQEGWAGKNAYMAAAPLGFGDAMSVASRRLLDAGIPGLSYWDGNSRSAAEGTRNYVMFPGTEDRIRILRKYGLLGPAAAGMLGGEE